jgi:hypothetical protein
VTIALRYLRERGPYYAGSVHVPCDSRPCLHLVLRRPFHGRSLSEPEDATHRNHLVAFRYDHADSTHAYTPLRPTSVRSYLEAWVSGAGVDSRSEALARGRLILICATQCHLRCKQEGACTTKPSTRASTQVQMPDYLRIDRRWIR